MKHTKEFKLLAFLIIVSLFAALSVFAGNKHQVLVITGGHKFNETEFFNMFDSIDDIEYTAKNHPSVNDFIASDSINQFDALVFYDMIRKLDDKYVNAYQQLTKKGIGLIFLHHAIVSYDNQPKLQKIVGGHYLSNDTIINQIEYQKSGYSHDEKVEIHIVDKTHSITKGINDFNIYDETYSNTYVSPEVVPLLTTNHPKSNPVIGWCHRVKSSKIVVLQSGHDQHAFQNETYRKLIGNAISWVCVK